MRLAPFSSLNCLLKVTQVAEEGTDNRAVEPVVLASNIDCQVAILIDVFSKVI